MFNWFWINWKNQNRVVPECQSLGPTAPGPRRLPSDSGRRRLVHAHGFTAAISPPTVSPLPRHCRPQTLAAIKGTHPTAPPFPPPLSRRGQPTPASLRPILPCPEQRATVYNLLAPRAVDHHPRMPPPPPFPSGQPHLTVEHVLLVIFFLPAAPKRVHHPTALLSKPSPLHLIAGRRRNPVGPPPAPPWPSALPCLH
jgi:hypothetical protein